MGDSIRQSIRDGINENRDLINKLLQNGVTVTDGKQVEVGKNVLDGVSFCFTGTRECILQVEMLGAEIKNSVAKSKPSPDFLVQKDPLSTSGKTKNAEANGHTKVISLDYLKKCIQTKDLAFFAK
jgi:NAD-dependent DNA ligase